MTCTLYRVPTSTRAQCRQANCLSEDVLCDVTSSHAPPSVPPSSLLCPFSMTLSLHRYLILNVDSSPRWGWPSHTNCTHEEEVLGCPCCYDCKSLACTRCIVPYGPNGTDINIRAWLADLCDDLPADYLVDYVRVWQQPSAINIGCDTPSHPTREYIRAHADLYRTASMEEPLVAVVPGDGSCVNDTQCLWPRGMCSEGLCKCQSAQGERPLAPLASQPVSSSTHRSISPSAHRPCTQAPTGRAPSAPLKQPARVPLAGSLSMPHEAHIVQARATPLEPTTRRGFSSCSRPSAPKEVAPPSARHASRCSAMGAVQTAVRLQG